MLMSNDGFEQVQPFLGFFAIVLYTRWRWVIKQNSLWRMPSAPAARNRQKIAEILPKKKSIVVQEKNMQQIFEGEKYF